MQDHLLQVGVGHAALLHGADDGGEVVVGDDDLGRAPGHLGAGDAHRHAHLGARQRGRIVDAVAHAFELGAVHGAIATARDAEFARDGQAGELVDARDHDRADAGDPALGDRELDLLAWRIDLVDQAEQARP